MLTDDTINRFSYFIRYIPSQIANSYLYSYLI